jgi:pyridoxine 5-phosphate synthase
MIEGAKKIGTENRIVYRGVCTPIRFRNQNAILPYTQSAILANDLGLGINAGHDLSWITFNFFKQNIPGLLEQLVMP